MNVSIDFETRSLIDLPERGLDIYAKDDSTEVICMAYSIDGGDVQLWTPDQPLPKWMWYEDTIFTAWNAALRGAALGPVSIFRLLSSDAFSAALTAGRE